MNGVHTSVIKLLCINVTQITSHVRFTCDITTITRGVSELVLANTESYKSRSTVC